MQTEIWRSYSECSFFEIVKHCSGFWRTGELPVHCFPATVVSTSKSSLVETPVFWSLGWSAPLHFICLLIQPAQQRHLFFQCFLGDHRISCPNGPLSYWPLLSLLFQLKVAGESHPMLIGSIVLWSCLAFIATWYYLYYMTQYTGQSKFFYLPWKPSAASFL